MLKAGVDEIKNVILDTGGDCCDVTVHEMFISTSNFLGSGKQFNVSVVLYGEDNEQSDILLLNDIPQDTSEERSVSRVTIKTSRVKDVKRIDIRREDKRPKDRWFLDHIRMVNCSADKEEIFPLGCWVQPNFQYQMIPYDSILPQDDLRLDQRRLGVNDKKSRYQLQEKIKGTPPRVISLPDEENFPTVSFIPEIQTKFQEAESLMKDLKGDWETLDEIKLLYSGKVFAAPSCMRFWKEDEYFGSQRLASQNPTMIKLCTEIPDKLAVTSAMMAPFLEGLSLGDSLRNKRIFIVDLDIMNQALTKNESLQVCAPIALFFVNQKGCLMPIAIQLFQENGSHNPVFLPSDPKNVWLFAKMWFNHADANLHESLTHLCYTHLVMEGIAVSTHANFSVSHPVFKLLAPHFLYLLSINNSADETLISEGGWVDKIMTIGRIGMIDLMSKMRTTWRMDVHGTLPADLKTRGVDDPDILPGYHYRDDGLLVYNAVKSYVAKYIDIYYDTSVKITQDYELQGWADALSRPVEEGGCGISGVPGQGRFTNTDDVVATLASVICTASITHAAVGYPQYDEYGYPPNYPLLLSGGPPSSKTDITEDDLVKCLPSKEITLETIMITNILSTRAPYTLGDFEVQYIFDPKALKVVEEFRRELKAVGERISASNKYRRYPYPYLHPGGIPNAISI